MIDNLISMYLLQVHSYNTILYLLKMDTSISMIIEIFVMVIASIVVSYILFSNMMLTFRNGVYNHLNKLYMSLAMGTAMGMIQTLMMLMMGHTHLWLIVLLIVFTGLTVILIVLIRTQTFIKDSEFLKSMIEHHDSAILMASSILQKSDNPDVRQLATSIINDQQREIEDMRALLR